MAVLTDEEFNTNLCWKCRQKIFKKTAYIKAFARFFVHFFNEYPHKKYKKAAALQSLGRILYFLLFKRLCVFQ